MVPRAFQRIVLLAILTLASPAATAQIQSAPAPKGPATQSGQPGAMAVDGIEFTVTQLVRNDAQNTVRLILQATDTSDPGRWLSFVQPAASMIDNMGNQWVAVSSRGIRICGFRDGVWDENPQNCRPGSRSADDSVRLTPGVPQVAVLEFAPADGGVIKETLDLASNATLSARLLIAQEDNSKLSDLTIPFIALPK